MIPHFEFCKSYRINDWHSSGIQIQVFEKELNCFNFLVVREMWVVAVDLDVFHVSLVLADEMMHTFVQVECLGIGPPPYNVKDDMLLLFGWHIDEMVAHCLFSSMVVASKVWSTKMHLILLTNSVTVMFNHFFSRYFIPYVYTARSFPVLKTLLVKE